jgi:hypothetical protein
MRGGILDRVRASGVRAHEIFIRYLVCRNFRYSVEVFAQLGHECGEVLRILENFRQGLTSNLHFRQFNGSKTRIADKVEMRNLQVLIELSAINCFQRRQRIGSSHKYCNLSH